MKIDVKFTIEPSDDTDDYLEVYTAVITAEGEGIPEGTTTIGATEEDMSYDGFRASVLEGLFKSALESAGFEVNIETEDYAIDETEVVDNVFFLEGPTGRSAFVSDDDSEGWGGTCESDQDYSRFDGC